MTWKITQNKDWQSLEKQFQWVADMKEVAQHKEHHAEGNVAIHTQMVLSELGKNSFYKSLPEQEQEILWAATLLHDVEKRSTSQDEGGGKISANGHARKGEYTTRSLLYRDTPTPFHIREQVASLVRFHGLPLWLMEKDEPVKKIHKVSLRANTEYLKALAESDARGRICKDQHSLLESLELFELFCKEQECWGKSLEFPTSTARFEYFNTIDGYVGYVPFDNFKSEVTLLSGLPGMGKDHYIQSLKQDIPVISLDAIRRKHKFSPTDRSDTGRTVQMAKESARQYLRKGQDFIWNATNITQLMRQQLVDLFTTYDAKVKIVYVEKPYSVWRSQNKNREFPLPENVLDKMLSKLEIPQLYEAHEVEYMIEN
ncbi:MAG: AAA family ATPase [Dysgonomonas sp.]|nr:AAA family ATPase [Dysgonomonas sp.]